LGVFQKKSQNFFYSTFPKRTILFLQSSPPDEKNLLNEIPMKKSLFEIWVKKFSLDFLHQKELFLPTTLFSFL